MERERKRSEMDVQTGCGIPCMSAFWFGVFIWRIIFIFIGCQTFLSIVAYPL
jgi:hypothetical protein